MNPRRLLLLAALASPAFFAEPADGQIRASEKGMVMQTIDGTEITLEYYRPRTRGRTHLFGHDAVVWEHIWTPGANWATTIEFERPITIDGRAIEPGKYSVWMEMSEAEFMPETFVLEPEVLIFHTNPPQPRDAQVRMPMEITDGAAFTDVLTWNFEEIRSDGATLALRWGTWRADFDIGVEPSMRMTVTEDEAAPMLGVWEILPPPGVTPPPGTPNPTMTIAVNDARMLTADIEGMPMPDGAFFNSVDLRLIPFADGIFKPAEYYADAVQEVWDAFLEADIEGGEVVGFKIRDEMTDEVFMSFIRRD